MSRNPGSASGTTRRSSSSACILTPFDRRPQFKEFRGGQMRPRQPGAERRSVCSAWVYGQIHPAHRRFAPRTGLSSGRPLRGLGTRSWVDEISLAASGGSDLKTGHFQERSTANVAQTSVVVSRPLALAASAATRRPYDSPRVERYERSECRAILGRCLPPFGSRRVSRNAAAL
jgi:hypothetical protein